MYMYTLEENGKPQLSLCLDEDDAAADGTAFISAAPRLPRAQAGTGGGGRKGRLVVGSPVDGRARVGLGQSVRGGRAGRGGVMEGLE